MSDTPTSAARVDTTREIERLYDAVIGEQLRQERCDTCKGRGCFKCVQTGIGMHPLRAAIVSATTNPATQGAIYKALRGALDDISSALLAERAEQDKALKALVAKWRRDVKEAREIYGAGPSTSATTYCADDLDELLRKSHV